MVFDPCRKSNGSDCSSRIFASNFFDILSSLFASRIALCDIIWDDMLKQILTTSQIGFSIALIILILMQARGTGLGRTGAGGGASFTRRGLEMLIFRLTFIVTALFLIVSIGLLFV